MITIARSLRTTRQNSTAAIESTTMTGSRDWRFSGAPCARNIPLPCCPAGYSVKVVTQRHCSCLGCEYHRAHHWAFYWDGVRCSGTVDGPTSTVLYMSPSTLLWMTAFGVQTTLTLISLSPVPFSSPVSLVPPITAYLCSSVRRSGIPQLRRRTVWLYFWDSRKGSGVVRFTRGRYSTGIDLVS